MHLCDSYTIFGDVIGNVNYERFNTKAAFIESGKCNTRASYYD